MMISNDCARLPDPCLPSCHEGRSLSKKKVFGAERTLVLTSKPAISSRLERIFEFRMERALKEAKHASRRKRRPWRYAGWRHEIGMRQSGKSAFFPIS